MSENDVIAINSEEDLKQHAQTILRRINRSERDGLLFLLNPVLALKDAGFELNLAMRRHIKRGLRYGADTKKRLHELEREIEQQAGRAVHVASNADVSQLLFEELRLSAPGDAELRQQEDLPGEPAVYESEFELAAADTADYEELRVRDLKTALEDRGLPVSGTKEDLVKRLASHDRRVASRPKISDDLLERMRAQHPIVPQLLEARRLLNDGWQFVNRATYEKVKAGASVTLLRGVKFARRADRATPEGGD